MKVIAGPRGSGKTYALLKLANEDNGLVLTFNKRALQVKAKDYGFQDVEIIDWNDLLYGNSSSKPLYIDNAEYVLSELFESDYGLKLTGLSISTEE